MKRHVIIGQFGKFDQFSFSKEDDQIITILNLVSIDKGLNFGIGRAINDLSSLGVVPSEIGLDFLILAAHIYAADTRISRATESQDNWTREIHLVVPVSNSNLWTDVTPLLKRMLNFLTGDLWTFDFRPRPKGFTTLVPRRGKKHKSYDNLALFSGGLDSLIGAVNSLEDGKKPLFISHAGEGATGHAQDACFRELKEKYQELPFGRLRVWMNFPQGLVQGVSSESSTRGRSFLFFAIGVFAGTGLENGFTLQAPENGLIAVNVPLDPLRLGSLSTRTMHPFYVARWNELLETIGVRGHIENPYWNKTKGEMVAACSKPELLLQLVPLSLSCSSPAKARWQKHSIEHCGYCLPCIIRRAALEKAFGPGMDPTKYTLSDLTNRVIKARQAEGQQIRSFQFAIQRLRTDPDIAKLLIYKSGPLSDLSSKNIDALAKVYQRGMNEVGVLLANVQTQSN